MSDQKFYYKDFTTAQLVKMYNPKNPRWMPDSQREALEASLQEFGLVEPVIVNEQTNQVVGGHQRIGAATVAGIKKITAVVVNLLPHEEMALNLSLNKISGDWDYDKLGQILADFDNEEDFLVTGFNSQEVDAIIANVVEEAENAAFGSDGVIEDIRNRSDEEVEAELESTIKVQFGMFTKHIPVSKYEAWVDRLTSLSPNGSSPAALGAVVAQMLNIALEEATEATQEEETTDYSQN